MTTWTRPGSYEVSPWVDQIPLPLHDLADPDTFDQMLAVFEAGAHLDLLALQGRATALDDGPSPCLA